MKDDDCVKIKAIVEELMDLIYEVIAYIPGAFRYNEEDDLFTIYHEKSRKIEELMK